MVKAWKIIVPVSLGLFVLGCSGSDTAKEGGTTTTTTTGGGGDVAPMVTAAQVMDVISQHCMPCHGGAEPPEELNMETIAGVLKGSEHGAIVVAGDAANSKIIQAMRGTGGMKKMPPKGDAVSEEHIKLIEDWINAGAKTE
jgi:uncharacterized membrane protein